MGAVKNTFKISIDNLEGENLGDLGIQVHKSTIRKGCNFVNPHGYACYITQ
jgi:hypothetical protein